MAKKIGKKILEVLSIIYLLTAIFIFISEEPAWGFFALVVAGLFFWGSRKVKIEESRGMPTSNRPAVERESIPVAASSVSASKEESSSQTGLCPSCKSPLEEGMFFCGKCGTRVR